MNRRTPTRLRPQFESLESRLLLSALANTGLNFNPTQQNALYHDTTVNGNAIYFRAQQSQNPITAELSGSPVTFTQVNALNPAAGAWSNNQFIFGASGAQLWKSAGTAPTTTEIIDLDPAHTLNQSLAYFTAIGPYTYFVAGYFPAPSSGTISGHPTEDFSVYRTDGTAAGTLKLADYGANSASQITNVNGTAFWATSDGITMSDGTPAGTVNILNTNTTFLGSTVQHPPANLTAVGNLLYYTITDDAQNAQLWQINPADLTTTLVAQFPPQQTAFGSQVPSFSHLLALNNTLVFQLATQPALTLHFDLYRSDGASTGTYLLQDLGQSQVTAAAQLNGKLYLAANGDAANTLYQTDGTLAGTSITYQFASPANAEFLGLTVYQNHLLFSYGDSTLHQLWTSDGAAPGTALLATLNIGETAFVNIEALAGDTLLLRVGDVAAAPDQAWTYDLNTPPAQLPLTGWIDAATQSQIVGWAVDPNNPGDPLSITLNIDGKITPAVLADQTRPDLTMFSNNQHGFTAYQIPALSTGAHLVKIVATNARTGQSILLGSKTILVTPIPAQGFLDILTPTRIAGWTLDPNTPTTATLLTVKIDGNTLSTAFALLVRNDLTPVFGAPNHGFDIALPLLSPGSHRIDLYAADTDTYQFTLFASRSINILPPTGYIDTFTPTLIAGWAFSPTTPTTPIAIRCTIDNQTTLFIPAADSRPDLLSYLGSTNHAFTFSLPPLTPGAHRITLEAYDPATHLLTLLTSTLLTFP